MPAAGIAEVYVCNERENSIDEILMAYALAARLVDLTFSRYSRQKQTLGNKDIDNVKLALKLARAVIPENHPLLLSFLKEVEWFTNDNNLTDEIIALTKSINNNA